MSSPSSPIAISPIVSWTFWISSKVHSAPSNSGRMLPRRLAGLLVAVVANLKCLPLRCSGCGAVGREQLVEHREYVLRRRHPPHGEVPALAGDLGVAVPDGRLDCVVEALAMRRLDVGEILA